MINQQVVDYIKNQLQQGFTKEQITSSLSATGWQINDIEEAFNVALTNGAVAPVAPAFGQMMVKLPGATAILGQAWNLYKQRIGTLIAITIMPMLLLYGLIALNTAGVFKSPNKDFGLILIPILLIAFVIFLIIQAWCQVALLYAINGSAEGIGFMESYRRAKSKILSYYWVSILSGFIVLGGSMFFLVPGVVFAVWFSLGVFVMISENLKGMDALMKSKEYVRGYWGGVFWRLIFMGVLYLIISFIVGFVMGFSQIPHGSNVASLLVALFVSPLVLIYSFMVYSNLKTIKGNVVSTSKKGAFIFVAIAGFLIVPGILASVVLVSLNQARIKSRDAVRQIHINQIKMGLLIYSSENEGGYPQSLTELSPKYLPSVPVDPKTNAPYKYEQEGAGYQVCTELERMENEKRVEKCVSAEI